MPLPGWDSNSHQAVSHQGPAGHSLGSPLPTHSTRAHSDVPDAGLRPATRSPRRRAPPTGRPAPNGGRRTLSSPLFPRAIQELPLANRTSRSLSPRARRSTPKYRCWCNRPRSVPSQPGVRPRGLIRSDVTAPHWLQSCVCDLRAHAGYQGRVCCVCALPFEASLAKQLRQAV